MSRGNNSKYVIFFKIWIHIGYLSTFKELLWILYGPILCIIVDWLYFVKFWKKYAKITIWYNLKIDAKILHKLTNFMSYRCFQSTLQYILFVFFVQIIYRNDKNRQFFLHILLFFEKTTGTISPYPNCFPVTQKIWPKIKQLKTTFKSINAS